MPTLPLVGDEFAGYQLRAVIGRGGMSVVFQAENPRLGNVVALKVLAPELATHDVFRTRFLHESRTAASLNHPNVIPIYDVGPCDDLLYIAMRYVDGTDLRALLKKERQIPTEKALTITGQVARALDAAHRRGLVHRDVKPGNILLEETDEETVHVYLADFGITKHTLSRSGLTSTGEFLGTIDYVAPEQIQGQAVDGRADQYSLGCVLYECLTGTVPFDKDLDAAVIWAHVQELPPMPSILRPDLPSAVDEVFGRVMAKQPADRYPSCREFVEAARMAMASPAAEPQTLARRVPPDSARASEPPPAVVDRPGGAGKHGRPAEPGGDSSGAEGPPRRRHGRRWLAAFGALVLVIAAGVGGWLALRGSGASHTGAHSSPAAMGPKSPLLRALVNTNRLTNGALPPSKCHQESMTQVTCSNPSFTVTSVTFRMYPSLTDLYKAYVAKVKSLNSGSFTPNTGNCSHRLSHGEVSWNHNFSHPRNFSVQQVAMGNLDPASQAEGRVFCNIPASTSLYTLVWTQNGGHLLAWMTATDHEVGIKWWAHIHHNIPIGSMQMHM